jgi:hypothetical protein
MIFKFVNKSLYYSDYFIIMIEKYLRETWYLRKYIVSIVFGIGLSYSVYYFFDPETIANIGDEDQLFEWLTAISLFFACCLCFYLFIKTKYIFYLLLSLLFFFGTGEEISWGQRCIGFKTPELMNEINVQKEFSIHNLEIFNTDDFQNHRKAGLARLLEINFLFRLFMIFYGILLPFFAYHIKKIGSITEKMKLPIPPISVGIFFFINWFVFWLLHTYVVSTKYGLQYFDTVSEIFEFLGSFILLIISLYFFIDRKKIVIGRDIKDRF